MPLPKFRLSLLAALSCPGRTSPVDLPNKKLAGPLASALGHLGEIDEARRVWRELKEINPRYAFSEHFGRQPFKNEDDVRRIAGPREGRIIKLVKVQPGPGEDMDKLNLQNPLFATYAIAAAIMILKAVGMSWLTVVRMTQEKGGFRSPEDMRKTLLNPEPSPKQLEPNERVERIRRIQLNDLENLPFFLVAGLLFVLTDPSLTLARWLLYGYVVSRLLHFAAYFTAQTHDMRATFWTVGSLILIFMTGWTLVAALGR